MGNVQRRRVTVLNMDFTEVEKRVDAFQVSQEDKRILEEGGIPSFLRRLFDPNKPMPTPTGRHRQ